MSCLCHSKQNTFVAHNKLISGEIISTETTLKNCLQHERIIHSYIN